MLTLKKRSGKTTITHESERPLEKQGELIPDDKKGSQAMPVNAVVWLRSLDPLERELLMLAARVACDSGRVELADQIRDAIREGSVAQCQPNSGDDDMPF